MWMGSGTLHRISLYITSRYYMYSIRSAYPMYFHLKWHYGCDSRRATLVHDLTVSRRYVSLGLAEKKGLMEPFAYAFFRR